METQQRYADTLRTLVLRHEQVIRAWEGRLDDMATDLRESERLEPAHQIVRCQLEGMILQAESYKADKEHQLAVLEESIKQQAEWEAQQNTDGPTALDNPRSVRCLPRGGGTPFQPQQFTPLPLTRLPLHASVDLRTVLRTVLFIYPEAHPGVGRALLETAVANQDTHFVDPETGDVPLWPEGEGIAPKQWREYMSVPGLANVLPLSVYPDCQVDDGAVLMLAHPLLGE